MLFLYHALVTPKRRSRSSPAVDRLYRFDRHPGRVRRNRAAPHFSDYEFVRAQMIDGIAERLASVKRSFDDVLDLGCFDGGFTPANARRIVRIDAGRRFAAAAGGIQADEDHLPIAAASVDLVVSAGVLDSVNDVPGTLTLARGALRPDGLFQIGRAHV